MGFKWTVAPSQTIPQMVEAYTKTVFLSGRRVAAKRATDMESWAKVNAPWTDRTTKARQGLKGVVAPDQGGSVIEIKLTHDPDLDYPIWLEVANQGRYAIIAPAIDYWGPIFMRDLQRMMNLGLITRGPVEE